MQVEHGDPKWKGLADSDDWQIGALRSAPLENKRRGRELDFWFGKPAAGAATHAGAVDHDDDDEPVSAAMPKRQWPRRAWNAPAAQARALYPYPQAFDQPPHAHSAARVRHLNSSPPSGARVGERSA